LGKKPKIAVIRGYYVRFIVLGWFIFVVRWLLSGVKWFKMVSTKVIIGKVSLLIAVIA